MCPISVEVKELVDSQRIDLDSVGGVQLFQGWKAVHRVLIQRVERRIAYAKPVATSGNSCIPDPLQISGLISIANWKTVGKARFSLKLTFREAL